jgi:tRNA-dihydrouridine synthase A
VVSASRDVRGGGVDSHRLSVAPMLDCTDTHFRRVCRLMSRRVHLWTEMINQDAIIYSHREKPQLLAYGTGGFLLPAFDVFLPKD